MSARPAEFSRWTGVGVIQAVLDLSETVASGLFLKCLHALLARHSLLPDDPEEGRGAPLADDWAKLPRDEIERQFAEVLHEDRLAPFATWEPPVRSQILTLPDGASRVLISYDSTRIDGISFTRLLKELLRSYDAAQANLSYTPPRIRTRREAPEIDYAAASTFWRAALAGLVSRRAVSYQPAGLTGPHDDGFAQGTHHVTLPATLLAGLQASSAAMQVPLAVTIYAACALCLHRVERTSDIAFLAIRNLRAGAGLDQGAAIGALVNSMPFRAEVDRTQMLSDFVRGLAATWEASRPYVGCSLPWLHAICDLHDHDWATCVLVERERYEWLPATAPVGKTRRLRVHDYSNVPLTVSITYGTAVNIALQYWSEHFSPAFVATIAESLAALLAGIADNPHRSLGALPYLAPRQQAELERLAAGPRDIAAERLTLHGDFEAQAARSPDTVALSDDAESLTYAELDAAADALAEHLITCGIRPDEPVAICNERDARFLIGLLATLKAGAAFLPVAPSAPDEQIRRIFAAADVRWALCSKDLAGRLAAFDAAVVELDERRPMAAANSLTRSLVNPDRLAYVIATSGTTGTPKIVEVPHRAAANAVRYSVNRLYAAGDLALVPWTDATVSDAAIHQIFAPLGCGGTLVRVLDPGRLKSHPHFAFFTAFGATPSMLSSLLTAGAVPPSVSAIMFGGEACPPGLVERLRSACRLRRAVNVYGPTEAAIYCTADDALTPATSTVSRIGRPIANMRVDLLDEALQPVLPGAPGEIYISGVGLARGYRGRSDLTDAAFRLISGADGRSQRAYCSGDLGVWLPDGTLGFLGRRDRQVKLRGIRLELDAIEHELRLLPGVQQAVVAIRPASDIKQRLVGWVMAEPGRSADSLLQDLRTKLPRPMVPDALTVVERIPLTSAGKPNLAALPDPPASPEAAMPSESPNNKGGDNLFRGLAALIAKTLSIPTSTITGSSTIHNTWGWNSLRHMLLMMELEESFAISLSDAEISAATSVAAIKQLLQSKGVETI